tara:strand:- start:4199 stop:4672 length:474 start_codon:yes stop_codon:yes gene_type:complete
VLTHKQKRFVEQYLVDFNATKAAIRAGYSEKSAAKIGDNLKHEAGVIAAIKAGRAKQTKRSELDHDYVLDRLKTIAERCMQGEPVFDKKGVPTGEWVFLPAPATKALELLGKHVGMWSSGVSLTITSDGDQAGAEINPANPELSNVIRLFKARGKAA